MDFMGDVKLFDRNVFGVTLFSNNEFGGYEFCRPVQNKVILGEHW